MKKLNWFLIVVVFATFSFGTWTLNSSAQYTKLLDFAGTNGSTPYGDLYFDGTFLYGMTVYGGTSTNCGSPGCGVIFKIKPDGTGDTVLLNFSGNTNGSTPYFSSLISDGTFLYGTTTYGGTNSKGVIFKIKPDGTGYSKLHDFSYNPDGYDPNSSLISDGIYLYGMTEHGGASGTGTIFKIKPDGTGYVKLFDFAGANGSTPIGSLIFDGTFLYGMTLYGGTSTNCFNGCGVIFKIKPDGTGDTVLLNFIGTSNGSNPYGSLFSDGTFLYGMTYYGGTNNYGTIFKIKPDGTGDTILLNFSGATNGKHPYGSFIFDGTFLYGMTSAGGANSKGVIFKIKPDGTGYSDLLDFAGMANGRQPLGSLISDGTFLYGMTMGGGTSDKGVVFKYALATGTAENNSGTDFSIYPNPTKGKFTITHDDNIKLIEVLNLLGEVISYSIPDNNKTATEIDLTNVPRGIYFVKVDNGEKVHVGKVVIN